MKERPILFSGAMVRALLSGAKTQTRRALRVQPVWDDPERPDRWTWRGRRGVAAWGPKGHRPSICALHHGLLPECPHGQAGDRLWVRETWAPDQYRADVLDKQPDRIAFAADFIGEPARKWRPSIHMPRSASRITLEVTGVRVERLQDISEADALGEGISTLRTQAWDLEHFPAWRREFDAACAAGAKPPVGPLPSEVFRALWEQINGPGSWEANPWCWAIDFRRLP